MPGPIALGPASVLFTGRAEGDLGSLAERGPSGPSEAMIERRRALVDRPWTWLRQVHGGDVVTVASPGEFAGAEADGAVSRSPGVALAILTADCVPIALVSHEGVIGVAHAGWRGLTDGVIANTIDRMRSIGATEVVAAIGPCVHAACYEFSPADLDAVAGRLGDVVRGTTSSGRTALDLPAAVRVALGSAGADVAHDSDVCTACAVDATGDHAYFSFRARNEESRQATVVWCD